MTYAESGHKHSFDIGIAAAHGIAAALLYEYIRFWTCKNANTRSHEHEGRYWVYCSITDLQKIYSYLSVWQIKDALNKLRDAEMIMRGNFNKKGFDRTNWYTLKALPERSAADRSPSAADRSPSAADRPPSAADRPPSAADRSPIPIIDTIIDTDIDTVNHTHYVGTAKGNPPERRTYGKTGGNDRRKPPRRLGAGKII